MTRHVLAVAIALTVAGCTHTRIAYSEQVRKTADGGTILLHDGEGTQDAVVRALMDIDAHCRGVFEIVETAKTGTGQSFSSGSAYSAYGWTAGSSATSLVFGTSITYVCRRPVNTELNQSVIEFAMAGRTCNTENDCWGLPCVPKPGLTSKGVCVRTQPSGSAGLPTPTPQGIGARCTRADPCPGSLACAMVEGKDYGYCVGGTPK